MISLQDVTYTWEDGTKGLRALDLEIKRGEFVLVSGVSGSGKSTLGSVINGLIPHYHKGMLTGKVFVEGKAVEEMMLHEVGRRVGTVFQDPRSQFFTTTTDEEIAFGLQTLVKTKKEIRQRVEEVYEDLDICDLKGKSVFELSSGEKQKIAIAGVYAMKPSVMILDEPSANLDMKATCDLYRVLEKLKTIGTTMILIEHRLFYAKSLVDRFLLIHKGEVALDCNREELLRKDKEFFETKGLRFLDLKDCEPTPKDKSETSEKSLISGKDLCFYHQHAHCRKNKVPVFEKLSFDMKKGKTIGLVGGNGVGKTTLARVICGIGKLCKGEILNKRGKVAKSKELLRQSYFVFQDSDYQLFCESVMAEMLVGLPLRQRDHDREKALSFLQALGLEDYEDKHPFSLSRGEKQRLTIACGLMKNAELFIYDEPTSGCDRNSMLAVSKLIKNQSEQGITCLVISHDYEFLLHTVDEVWVMDKGVIQKVLDVKTEDKESILTAMMGGGICENALD